MKVLAAIGIALALVATATAQTLASSEKVTFRDATLIVPSISGFRFLPKHERSNFEDIVMSFALPDNRLLTALLTDADLKLIAAGRPPELDDCLVLQIPRSIENRTVTLKDFQHLRREIRKLQESGQLKLSPDMRRQLAEASKQMSERMGYRFEITSTDPIPLGVFEDTEHSIGVTSLLKARADTPTARSEELLFSASIATVIRGKLLYLVGKCAFRSMLDVYRCNSHVKSWLVALQAANR